MTTKYKKTGMPRQAEAAFTLVELLVTITIIAILVALSMFGYMKFRNP